MKISTSFQDNIDHISGIRVGSGAEEVHIAKIQQAFAIVSDGDAVKIESLIRQISNNKLSGIIDDVEDGGFKWTLLMHAIFLQDDALVEAIVKAGANLEIRNEGGDTALMLASRHGFPAATRAILDSENFVNVDELDGSGKTALMIAVDSGARGVVQEFASPPRGINGRGSGERTALINAAMSGSVEMVNLLISAGANIDAVDDEGKNSLMHAAINGDAATVLLLLSFGASVLAIDNNGQTAKDLAMQSGSPLAAFCLTQVENRILEAAAAAVAELQQQFVLEQNIIL